MDYFSRVYLVSFIMVARGDPNTCLSGTRCKSLRTTGIDNSLKRDCYLTTFLIALI